MNKKFLGISLIAISIIITTSNAKINGAVIGTTSSNFLSLISIALFLTGTIILISERKNNRLPSKIGNSTGIN